MLNIRDLNYKIANELDDRDLVSFFQVNRRTYNLSKDDMFWLNRIITLYPVLFGGGYLSINMLHKYRKGRSWFQYYIEDIRMVVMSLSSVPSKYISEPPYFMRLDLLILSDFIGADIHYNDEYLLRMSSIYGNMDIIRYLLANGANIHSKDDETVVLSSAYNHLKIVKYLVSMGADITGCNNLAIMLASQNGHLETVKYLVSLGADIHASNDYPLRLSKEKGHTKVVKYLESIIN